MTRSLFWVVPRRAIEKLPLLWATLILKYVQNGWGEIYQIQSFEISLYLLLTHCGRVTHICVSELTIIGSDNGLSPGRCQTIIWTNGGILLIGPLGTKFSEILVGIQAFSFRKNALENVVCVIASISSRPQWFNSWMAKSWIKWDKWTNIAYGRCTLRWSYWIPTAGCTFETWLWDFQSFRLFSIPTVPLYMDIHNDKMDNVAIIHGKSCVFSVIKMWTTRCWTNSSIVWVMLKL